MYFAWVWGVLSSLCFCTSPITAYGHWLLATLSLEIIKVCCNSHPYAFRSFSILHTLDSRIFDLFQSNLSLLGSLLMVWLLSFVFWRSTGEGELLFPDTYFQVFETINDQSLRENWQGTNPLYSRPQIKINCEFVSPLLHQDLFQEGETE